jgi:hypothetical protein
MTDPGEILPDTLTSRVAAEGKIIRASALDATSEDVEGHWEPMTPAGRFNQRTADCAVLRHLIDRRLELNSVALRPGEAVHVHALERLLADAAPGGPEYFERMVYHHDRDTLIADLAAVRTWAELTDGDDGGKPAGMDELIMRARALAGW